jgi:hypothetical protein
MNEWNPVERSVSKIFVVIALLMYFFPLLVIHAPIIGEQDVSEYDIFSKVNQFRGRVNQSPAEPQSQPETQPSRNDQNSSSETPLPLSVRIAWLIPLSVTGAFLLAAIAGIGTLISVRVSGIAALVGTVLAVGAISAHSYCQFRHALLDASLT